MLLADTHLVCYSNLTNCSIGMHPYQPNHQYYLFAQIDHLLPNHDSAMSTRILENNTFPININLPTSHHLNYINMTIPSQCNDNPNPFPHPHLILNSILNFHPYFHPSPHLRPYPNPHVSSQYQSASPSCS